MLPYSEAQWVRAFNCMSISRKFKSCWIFRKSYQPVDTKQRVNILGFILIAFKWNLLYISRCEQSIVWPLKEILVKIFYVGFSPYEVFFKIILLIYFLTGYQYWSPLHPKHMVFIILQDWSEKQNMLLVKEWVLKHQKKWELKHQKKWETKYQKKWVLELFLLFNGKNKKLLSSPSPPPLHTHTHK